MSIGDPLMIDGLAWDDARREEARSRLELVADEICCVCELGDPKPGGYLCRDCAADQGWWPEP